MQVKTCRRVLGPAGCELSAGLCSEQNVLAMSKESHCLFFSLFIMIFINKTHPACTKPALGSKRIPRHSCPFAARCVWAGLFPFSKGICSPPHRSQPFTLSAALFPSPFPNVIYTSGFTDHSGGRFAREPGNGQRSAWSLISLGQRTERVSVCFMLLCSSVPIFCCLPDVKAIRISELHVCSKARDILLCFICLISKCVKS